MYRLKLNNITEVKRGEHSSLYLGVINNQVAKKIPQVRSSHMMYSECIYINACDVIVKESIKDYQIELINPYVISHYPKGEEDFEYPILVSMDSGLDIILKALLNDEIFKNFVEVKAKNISKNSKKIMTVSSLQKVLENLSIQLQIEDIYELLDELHQYIHKLIAKNSELSYSTINEKQMINDNSVINSTNAWYIYFRYFFHQWKINKIVHDIPNLQEKFYVDGWEGAFFDRSNPIWGKIFSGSRRKHYPSKNIQIQIYKYWISLKKPS